MEDDYLAKEILRLPIKFREVIILFYYEELSIEEVSILLKININTVKTRLYRARKNLQEALKGSEYEWKGE